MAHPKGEQPKLPGAQKPVKRRSATRRSEKQEVNILHPDILTASSSLQVVGFAESVTRNRRQSGYPQNTKHLYDEKKMRLHTTGALHPSELIGNRKPF